ncbi:hypothetical protein TruAng_003089 [Truncatella angustata]|nr:hypothetical protein TruAng_003089 [Truncatella angustata]
MPLNLNDAFGWDIAIPLQLIIDWQSFNTILGILFQSQKGHDMVLKQQFALEEHFSGKDFARDSPLSECVRRGMRIDMSMIFETNIVLLGACPRCREDTDAPENVTIQCKTQNCGMWFRVLQSKISRTPVQEGFPGGVIREQIQGKSTSTLSIIAEPSDFQRVRMLNLIPVATTREILGDKSQLDPTRTQNKEH